MKRNLHQTRNLDHFENLYQQEGIGKEPEETTNDTEDYIDIDMITSEEATKLKNVNHQ